MSYWTLNSFKWPRTNLLPSPRHDQSHLPVPFARARRLRSSLDKCKDVQIVSEFRSKLRTAEEMISKLAFSLKEIQGMRRKKQDASGAPAKVLKVGERDH